MRLKQTLRKLVSQILLMAILVLSAGLAGSQKSQAATTYPVPHRSWIKLGSVAYQGTMTQAQIDWASAHIDWFDSPYSVFLPQYKAKTDAPILVYDNFYCLYVDSKPGSKWEAMVAYATAHSITVDSMLIHYSVDTTTTFSGETHTLSAGSRVPTYGWYGTGGDLTKNGARVITNPGSADFRAFNTQYEQTLTSTSYSGATYDGVFVDNTATSVLTNDLGTIIPGGGLIEEYPGNNSTASTNFNSDIVQCFSAVRAAFGPKGAPGSKLLAPNGAIGVYSSWTALFPYVDQVFCEFLIEPVSDYRVSVDSKVSSLLAAQSAGVPTVVSAYGMGSTSTDQPVAKLTALAEYYEIAGPLDYFSRQDLNSGDIQTWQWFGAVEYNVGQPKSPVYTFSLAADPGSVKIDSGTGTVTHTGSPGNYTYTLTDTNKNWAPNNYWTGTQVVDSAGNIFPVYQSGSNWISFYRKSEPYPQLGSYSVGSFVAKVNARDYDNALVLYRPKSDYNGPTGSGSTGTYTLPATSDNPSGVYYQLNADGTVDSTPITQITLQAAQGAILIKESALNRPTISKSVDKISASSGDTLTYTISYSNPTQTTYANAKIEDSIPAGTTYVADSATSGAVLNNGKIVLDVGSLAPGASGNFGFQVRVN